MKALVVFGVLSAGCVQYGPGPVTPMGTVQPEPVAVAGPPGGGVDPGYAYDQPAAQDPAMPGYPAGYPEGYPQGTEAGAPADPYAAESGGGGEGMGTVTDAQIDSTLAPYGEWVQNEEYGRVWRPYATVVGASFTPYETCGSWVWTDYGWTFTCDLDWGWLPFHYGYWDWFDNSWCWIPDYTWGPGWVDWRHGNGYVGWRPSRPRRDLVRDHRRQAYVPKPSRDSDWRFIPEHSLGRHVRGNLVATSVGLDNTRAVARPPVRGSNTIAASTLFGRRGARAQSLPYTGPSTQASRPAYRGQPTYPRTFDSGAYPRGQGPRYDQRYPSRGTYQPPRGTYQPSRGYQPPSRNTYQPPSGGYQPSRTYQPPTRTTRPPPSTYTPSRGSAPTRTYTPPSRSSGNSSYSRPSSSSSSGSSYRPSSSSSSSRGSSSSSSSSSSSRGSSSSSSGGSRGRR